MISIKHSGYQIMDICIVFLFVCHFLACRVTGANLKLSTGDDLKFETQLRLMNKPAIKTIKTQYGDLYDCVDFFKQPAFDHPLLKNTSDFQVLPPSILNTVRDQQKVNEIDKTIFSKVLECPYGTVPIKRITKEDLIKEHLDSKATTAEANIVNTHFAGLKTKAGKTNKYSGVGAFISINNPQPTGEQYSAARLQLRNGIETLQAGWRVDPSLYHDTHTRLFIRTDAGQTHCYNTLCPGFVVARHDFPPGSILPNISVWGENPFTIKLHIIRDDYGNWNLKAGPDEIIIGYWPSRLFTQLSGLASDLEWGGEVSTPTGRFPPMGLGNKYLRKDTGYNAFFRQVSLNNETGQITDAEDLEAYADPPYYVYDEGLWDQGMFRHTFFYGGVDQPDNI